MKYSNSLFLVFIIVIMLFVVGCGLTPGKSVFAGQAFWSDQGKACVGADTKADYVTKGIVLLVAGGSVSDECLILGTNTYVFEKGCKGGKTIVTSKNCNEYPFNKEYSCKDGACVKPQKIRSLGVINCSYATADDLLKTCPTEEEKQIIRNDFNIAFDTKELPPWICTNGGTESSIQLSMYNTFRLMKCIPFNQSFIWAPQYNNLYDWMKSLNLVVIKYGNGSYNYAGEKFVFMQMNKLGDSSYRKVIDSSTGVGAGYLPVLMAHESRHTIAGGGKLHNCAPDYIYDDKLTNLGAWSVQYYLLIMSTQNTGNFFSEYEKNEFNYSAKKVLDTRFCNK